MSVHSQELWHRFDRSLVPIAIAALLACLLYVFTRAFIMVYPGFSTNSEWIVIEIDSCAWDPGWCEANPDRLVLGDRLLAIGDLTFEAYQRQLSKVPFKGYRPGDRVPIIVQGAEGERLLFWQLPTAPINAWEQIVYGLAICAPFWLAGTLVLLFLRPRGPSWGLLVAFHYLTALFLAAGLVSATRWMASAIVLRIVTWLMVPVYLHLHLIVPSSLVERRGRYVLPFLYLGAAFFSLLELLEVLPQDAYTFGLLLAIGGSLFVLFWRLLHRTMRADRPVVRMMLAGIGMAMVPGLMLDWAVHFLSPGAPTTLTIAVSLLSVPILPFAYTYAIYRRRMGDLAFRAHRLLSAYAFALLYGTMLGLLLIVGERLLGTRERFAAQQGNLFLGLTVALVAGLVAPVARTRFQRWVDRLAYGAEHRSDDILQYFASRISAAVTREALSRLMTYQLAPSVLVRQWALYLASAEGGELLRAYGVPEAQAPAFLKDLSGPLSWAGRYRLPADGDGGVLVWAYLILPLHVGERLVGLWLLGKRSPDDYYPREDIRLLNTLSSQIAVTVENIRLYEQAQREIVERKSIEESLRREKDVSQWYLDVAGVMTVNLDRSGRVVDMNRRGYELLGYPEGELEGTDWFEVCLPSRVRSEVQHAFEQLVSTGVEPPETGEWPVLTRSGEERVISWHNTVLRDSSGAMVGTLSAGQDVTSRYVPR